MEHPDLRVGFLGFSKNRIESLTDAIFAFTMTLLVLGVGYPSALKAGASATVREILINSYPTFCTILITYSYHFPIRIFKIRVARGVRDIFDNMSLTVSHQPTGIQ